MSKLQLFLQIAFLFLLLSSVPGEATETTPPLVLNRVLLSLGTESFSQRSLDELSAFTSKCWSTRDERNPNRYCVFSDTPRDGTFLSLSCPTTKDDLSQCSCSIGIGDAQDAPNTDTCWKCGFCRDGSLAYDCRNVAEGICIGRTCLDDCVSSYDDPQNLMLESGGSKVPTSWIIVSMSLLSTASMLYF